MGNIYDVTGISVQVRSSKASGLLQVGALTDVLETYGHEIDVSAGFKSASMTLKASQAEAEDWLESGLARDITVFDEAQQIIWQGFVNSIALSFGGMSVTRGPVMEISNRIKCVYSFIDTSVNPNILGQRKYTAAANDTASQALYGVLETVYSTSGTTDADALQIRDTLLAENKEAQTSNTLNLSGSGDMTVQLDCLGYAAYLERYIYTYQIFGGWSLSTKLIAVLNADPNTLFNADLSAITVNTLSVAGQEVNDNTAAQIIKGLIARGDVNEARYIFGIYENRKPYYAAVPSNYDYQFSIAQQLLSVFNGGAVLPWLVRPGKWLLYTDFLIGRSVDTSNKRADMRSMFIESVSYSAPYGLGLNGGKVGTLAQKLARLGLSGV